MGVMRGGRTGMDVSRLRAGRLRDQTKPVLHMMIFANAPATHKPEGDPLGTTASRAA